MEIYIFKLARQSKVEEAKRLLVRHYKKKFLARFQKNKDRQSTAENMDKVFVQMANLFCKSIQDDIDAIELGRLQYYFNSGITDSKIIKCLQNETERDIDKGFSLIYQAYEEVILNHIKYCATQRIADNEAEDILQETMLILLDKIENKEEKPLQIGKVAAYLKKIAFYLCQNRFRSQRKVKKDMETYGNSLYNDPDHFRDFHTIDEMLKELELMKNKDTQKLRHCLDTLNDVNKDIMIRYYLKGESAEMIAQAYHKNMEWVSTRLFQNRKRLRKCFDQQGGRSFSS